MKFWPATRWRLCSSINKPKICPTEAPLLPEPDLALWALGFFDRAEGRLVLTQALVQRLDDALEVARVGHHLGDGAGSRRKEVDERHEELFLGEADVHHIGVLPPGKPA